MDTPPKVNNYIEGKKEGYDVEAHILFSRHAEKGSHSGGITEKGQQDAKEFGEKLKRLAAIKGYNIAEATHSAHKRTARTAFLINNPEIDPKTLPEFNKESEEGTKNVLPSSVDRYSEDADKKYAELSAGNFQNEGGGVEYFMKLGDQRYDEETPSSVEMSKMIAEDLVAMIDSTKKMPSGSKNFIPNIVHSGVFEHFLADLLHKRGEEKILDSMGGPLNFLGFDDFRMYIHRESPTSAKIQFRFRSRDEEGKIIYYDVTEDELKKIAGITN